MRTRTRKIWLIIASEIVILFGLLIALASMAATAAPTLFLADMIFWPVDGVQAVSRETNRLLAAILGGVMIGWGALLYLLTTRLYPDDPGLARLLITASLGVWFLIDSLGSIVAGAPLNAILNLFFLGMFLIPLWLPSEEANVEPAKQVKA
jgi:hypothetical protein